LQSMFERFGFEALHASVRANTVYQTQIGYISMKKDGPSDPLAPRLERMRTYAEIFAGQPVTDTEAARFFARHPVDGT
ncbi:MAG: TetR/AcrR family transcriptional regulator, partial [Pseudomonadota bacterium]